MWSNLILWDAIFLVVDFTFTGSNVVKGDHLGYSGSLIGQGKDSSAAKKTLVKERWHHAIFFLLIGYK